MSLGNRRMDGRVAEQRIAAIQEVVGNILHAGTIDRRPARSIEHSIHFLHIADHRRCSLRSRRQFARRST